MSRSKRDWVPDSQLDCNKIAGLVARNVRRLRKRLGWTVQECAVEFGVSVNRWSRIERGTYPQTAGANIDALAEFFEVGLRELLKKS